MSGIGTDANSKPLVEVRNLVPRFDLKAGVLGRPSGRVHAVENVSLDISGRDAGSGGGVRIPQVYSGTQHHANGPSCLEGSEMIGAPRKTMARFRREAQMIFQDPFSSLNPSWTARKQNCFAGVLYSRHSRQAIDFSCRRGIELACFFEPTTSV